MSTERVYRVIVTREDGAWLADIPELEGAHTYARTLPALDRAVREVLVLADDRPDADMPVLQLSYDYRTGDPAVDVTAAEVQILRKEADQLAARATARTRAAARLLVQRGLSVRDAAAILGISPQRVSQLTSTTVPSSVPQQVTPLHGSSPAGSRSTNPHSVSVGQSLQVHGPESAQVEQGERHAERGVRAAGERHDLHGDVR